MSTTTTTACASFRAFLSRLPHGVRTVGRSGAEITIQLITEPDATR